MKTPEEVKAEMNATPVGQFLASMGMSYYDTESSARRVAEKAVARIQELEVSAKNIEGTVSEYLATPCDSLFSRMRDARDRFAKRIYHSEL